MRKHVTGKDLSEFNRTDKCLWCREPIYTNREDKKYHNSCQRKRLAKVQLEKQNGK